MVLNPGAGPGEIKLHDVEDCTIERFPKAGNTSLNLIRRAIAAIVQSYGFLEFGFWSLEFFWTLFFGVWIFHASGEIAFTGLLEDDSICLSYY